MNYEQFEGIENGDEILMINDSTATHTSDHDFGALFKQKKMTLRYNFFSDAHFIFRYKSKLNV